MPIYNYDKIRKLRDQTKEKCQELHKEIEERKTKLIALNERVKVYNEFLKEDSLSYNRSSLDNSKVDPEKKNRAPRSTKAEMSKRKSALVDLFQAYGFMQPKEILSKLPNKLGYVLEQHHLRAVLKRFPKVFIQDPERHGFWGLSSSESNSQSTT